jgi:UMF1 family MFS transporter
MIEPGQFWLAVLIYVPANFAFNIGENFLAAFLPQLARRDDFGKVSGFSWGVAYSAALLMLVLTAAAMMLLDLKDASQWRPFFVAAGVWFFVFAIPTLLFLREGSAPAEPAGNLLTVGFARLLRTTREIGRFRDLAMLLVASFFYGGGMSVIVAFASILAVEFGFTQVELVIFVAVITVTGIAGTLVPTFFQDRLGHKRMTTLLLILWTLTALYLAWIAYQHAHALPGTKEPAWPVWVAGNLLGLGLGALGAANRAFVGFLTPPERSGEFFGLWGLVFKLAAILTIPFGYVKDAWGTWQAMIVLAGMLIVGLVLTALVDEKRGAAAVGAARD